MDKKTTIAYYIKYSRRKSISMKFSSDGNLLISAPIGVSKKFVTDFIESRRGWIERNYKKIKAQKQLVDSLGFYSDIEIKDMKKKAKEIIPSRVEYYAKKGHFSYNRVCFKLMRTQWGSCSALGNLNFNCTLSLMPLSIIDSIVVHELCHLRHLDHSSSFYKEVYNLCPNYDECYKWLKINGPRYLARISH